MCTWLLLEVYLFRYVPRILWSYNSDQKLLEIATEQWEVNRREFCRAAHQYSWDAMGTEASKK